MTKFFVIFLALSLTMGLVACAQKGQTAGGGSSDIPDAVTLLTTVWDKMPEDQKFSAIGGQVGGSDVKEDAPGTFPLDNADELDRELGFPAASVDKLQDAASLTHMLNANTFTCAAYEVKDGGDLETLGKELRDNIQARRWMCGFPDKVVVLSVESYLVSVFGAEDLVNAFRDTLTETYEGAKVLYDEAVQ